MKTAYLTLSLLLASSVSIACDYPERAKIADGETATKDEMIESQKSVKTYMAAMETYLACIDDEEKAARSDLEALDADALAVREEALTKKHNAAVEEMQIVADEFNVQVRAYKARSQ